jgi:hypothetical protein
MDKSKIEIVVARYDEDISWTKPFESITTIYNKGKDNITNSVNILNVGRESHTYLYHIVNNYDSLADITVFFQGGGPSFGYKGAKNGGHMFSNIDFKDYIYPDNEFHYIITSRITNNLSKLSIRNGYDQYVDIPKPVSPFPKNNKIDYWLKWSDFSNFGNYVNKIRIEQNGSDNLLQFWSKYISTSTSIHPILYYAQGAQFSISRRMIQQNSKEYYKSLLDELSYHINPYQGYYMEWLWLYIFTRHNLI